MDMLASVNVKSITFFKEEGSARDAIFFLGVLGILFMVDGFTGALLDYVGLSVIYGVRAYGEIAT